MSQEIVESVRAVYERWSEGDFRPDVDLFDPHMVMVVGPGFLDAGVHFGIEAVGAYLQGFLAPQTDVTMEAKEIIAAGDTMLVRVCQRAIGRASGIPTEIHHYTLWTFRGHKVIRVEHLRERAEALEAAGLQE